MKVLCVGFFFDPFCVCSLVGLLLVTFLLPSLLLIFCFGQSDFNFEGVLEFLLKNFLFDSEMVLEKLCRCGVVPFFARKYALV